MANFVKVANLSELTPGNCMRAELNGREIALFNVDGKVYALDNTCLHRGGPLGEGMLEGDVITCPWHMWQYNVRSGECLNNPSVRAATFQVQVEGNDIMVAL